MLFPLRHCVRLLGLLMVCLMQTACSSTGPLNSPASAPTPTPPAAAETPLVPAPRVTLITRPSTPVPIPTPTITIDGRLVIRVLDNAFVPSVVSVRPGTTVVWRHEGVVQHDVTGADGAWASSSLLPGNTYQKTFPQPGKYEYYCALHSGMSGIVIVEDN